MKIFTTDTIVAIATPPGRGGIGIVRLSGKDAKLIGSRITQKNLKPKIAQFTAFYDKINHVIDEGIVLFFENPHSFTGEDVVELQSHGSPIVLDQLTQCAIQHGARLAKPGEFSQRAFLNKKIDLVQAEAIADLIHASSEQAARSAIRSLQGEFSKKIQALQKSLLHLRMQIEAMIDFPEEEIDFLSDPKIHQLLQKTINDICCVKNQAKKGVLLQSGLHVALVGKPNAGKSSLLNYLSGRDSAIVTEIPGTTRDILRETIVIDGMPLHIVDTAGLRETTDIVEQEGVRRAHQQMAQADLILLLVDDSDSNNDSVNIPENIPCLIIKNKIDLTNKKPTQIDNIISLSIKNNLGMDLLIHALKKAAGFQAIDNDSFIARRRHMDAIERAHQFLLHGQTQLMHYRAGELLAEELRQAQKALSEITGEFTSDDLLGEIFSSFCIGK